MNMRCIVSGGEFRSPLAQIYMWVNKSKLFSGFMMRSFCTTSRGEGKEQGNVVGKVVKAHTLEEYIKVSVHQQHPFLSLFQHHQRREREQRVLHKKVHFHSMTMDSNQSYSNTQTSLKSDPPKNGTSFGKSQLLIVVMFGKSKRKL